MLIAYWSVKGGSGTTLVAAGHALSLAGRGAGPVVLADLVGDMPAVLGVAEPDGPGITDWVAAGAGEPGSLFDRCTSVSGGLELLHLGTAQLLSGQGGEALAAALAPPSPASAGGWGPESPEVTVVADCGVPRPGSAAWTVAAAGDHSILVVRTCYLALRLASRAPLRPSSMVLVVEPGRALDRHDFEHEVGVPVGAEVPWDPAIGRAVDAGLVATRLPRLLQRALRLGSGRLTIIAIAAGDGRMNGLGRIWR